MALSVGAVNSLRVHINAYRQSPTPETGVGFTIDGAVKPDSGRSVQEVPGAVYEPSSLKERALDAAMKDGVIYEKSAPQGKPATYTVSRMSADERAALVQQLKEEDAKRQQQFLDIVSRSVGEQSASYGRTLGYKQLFSSGRVQATADEILQAKKDTAADGYFGVNQTSSRLFDFAFALAGDDEGKMRRMQSAMQKGFDRAARAWGGSLPSISYDTLNAANRLFEDYYQSKRSQTALSA